MIDLVRRITDPDVSDQDRWLLRLALLEAAGVNATPEALAFIGNTTVEKARGAMSVLQADGQVGFTEEFERTE